MPETTIRNIATINMNIMKEIADIAMRPLMTVPMIEITI